MNARNARTIRVIMGEPPISEATKDKGKAMIAPKKVPN